MDGSTLEAEMILRKTVFALAGALLMVSLQTAIASPSTLNAPDAKTMGSQGESGVINRIDTVRNQVVISDMVFGFSAALVVRKGGKLAGISSLKPNQKIRFISEFPKPGVSLLASPRTVTEIWIDQD